MLHDTIFRFTDLFKYKEWSKYAHRYLIWSDIKWKRFLCCFCLSKSLWLPSVCYYVQRLKSILLIQCPCHTFQPLSFSTYYFLLFILLLSNLTVFFYVFSSFLMIVDCLYSSDCPRLVIYKNCQAPYFWMEIFLPQYISISKSLAFVSSHSNLIEFKHMS